MSQASPITQQALQDAQGLLQAGQSVQAEEFVLAMARQVEEQFGVGTPEYADAMNAVGQVQVMACQYCRAVESFEACCFGPEPDGYVPPDDQARRDLLSYLLNLGTALALQGDLDRSIQVIRQCVESRREFYGTTHSGYAFGLQPLAEALLRRGRLDEARLAIDEAVTIFRNDQHPRLPIALVIRAEIIKTAGEEGPALAEAGTLPDQQLLEATSSVVERSDQADKVVSRHLLAELLPMLESRFGPESQVVLNILAMAANIERILGDRGDHARRQAAIRRVIDMNVRQGRSQEAVDALLGLALAQHEAGMELAAVDSYEQAVEQVDRMGVAGLQSRVRYNFGNHLAKLERRDEAATILKQAVDFAIKAGNAELLGMGQVALGIFLQHAGRGEEAKPVLADGLRFLDPSHHDAICGRSHLIALESNSSCTCTNTEEVVTDSIRDFILARVPAELEHHVESLHVEPNGSIKLNVNGSPSPEELESLERYITHAHQEIGRRLRAQHHPVQLQAALD